MLLHMLFGSPCFLAPDDAAGGASADPTLGEGVATPLVDAQPEVGEGTPPADASPGETGPTAEALPPFDPESFDVSKLTDEQATELFTRGGANKALLDRMGEIARRNDGVAAERDRLAQELETAKTIRQFLPNSTEQPPAAPTAPGIPPALAGMLRLDAETGEYLLPSGSSLDPEVVQMMQMLADATAEAKVKPIHDREAQQVQERILAEAQAKTTTLLADIDGSAAEQCRTLYVDPEGKPVLDAQEQAVMSQDIARDVRDACGRYIEASGGVDWPSAEMVQAFAKESAQIRARAAGKLANLQLKTNAEAANLAPVSIQGGTAVSTPGGTFEGKTEEEVRQILHQHAERIMVPNPNV